MTDDDLRTISVEVWAQHDKAQRESRTVAHEDTLTVEGLLAVARAAHGVARAQHNVPALGAIAQIFAWSRLHGPTASVAVLTQRQLDALTFERDRIRWAAAIDEAASKGALSPGGEA